MLTLSIKKKWFDMILSGEKKEEYREIKPYYEQRFKKLWFVIGYENSIFAEEIRLRNGYSRNSPSFIAKCNIRIGTGRPEWGAEQGKEYYVLIIREIGKEIPN